MTIHSDIKENGYAVVKNMLSSKDIDNLIYQNIHPEYPFQSNDPKVAEINYNFNKLVDFANKAMNKDYKVFMQKIYFKNKFIGDYEVYHQDYFFRTSLKIPASEYLQVFIALENLYYTPLNVFTGSHKLGLLPHIDCLEKTGNAKYRIPNEILNTYKDSFTSIHLKKGSAIFFDYRLIHGSGSNATPFDQPRAVIQLCTHTIDKINHGSDRRKFEIDILNKLLQSKNE